MPNPGAITYSAFSMSRTGLRGLGVRTYSAAWGDIEEFMVRCAGNPEPKLLRLDLAKIAGTDREFATVEGLLGPATAGYSAGQTEYNWLLNRQGFHRAASHMDLLRSGPVQSPDCGRFQLRCDYDFLLWDDEDKKYLPFQGAEHYAHFEADYERMLGCSYVRATLGPGYSFNMFLSFPYVEPNERFEAYATKTIRHCPVRFSPKHWKRWSIARRGDSYVGRKFVPSFAT